MAQITHGSYKCIIILNINLGSIKVRRQTLPEINVHARLFDTLEYDKRKLKPQISSIFHFDRVSDGRMTHVLGMLR